MKTQVLNTRLFKELCKDMNAEQEVLFLNSSMLVVEKKRYVFEMKQEIKELLEIQETK